MVSTHGMRHQYFAFYANEFAWRADMSSGKKTQADKFNDAMQRIFKCGVSKGATVCCSRNFKSDRLLGGGNAVATLLRLI